MAVYEIQPITIRIDEAELECTPIDVAKLFFIIFMVSFVCGIAFNNGAK